MKKLRPGYKPPTRKTLSTTLLDKDYEKHSACGNAIDQESVLLIDGWKNSSANTKNVVYMLHNAPNPTYFLKSWDFTGQNDNAENLTKVFEEAIVLAKEMYNTKIYAVVSDNP